MQMIKCVLLDILLIVFFIVDIDIKFKFNVDDKMCLGITKRMSSTQQYCLVVYSYLGQASQHIRKAFRISERHIRQLFRISARTFLGLRASVYINFIRYKKMFWISKFNVADITFWMSFRISKKLFGFVMTPCLITIYQFFTIQFLLLGYVLP